MLTPTYTSQRGASPSLLASRRDVPISAAWPRVLLIVFMFLLISGVPMLLAGQTVATGRMLAAGVTLAFPLVALMIRPKTFRLTRVSDYLPVGLFAWFFICSALSNTYVFHYGTDNWLLAMYVVVPILLYYLWWSLGVTFEDILIAVMITGLIAAFIVVLDQFFRFPQLDELKRYSAFTDRENARRIIFLKNECVLALLLTVVAFYKPRRLAIPFRRLWLTLAIILMAFMIFQVFESRMAIAACAGAVVLYMLFSKATAKKRALMISGLIVAAVPVFLYVLDRYIAPLLDKGLSGYIEDYNVEIRIQSANYWLEQFMRTQGLGIGVMTLNVDTPNIQSSMATGSIVLNDMGMYAALYQFGIPGLIVAVIGTAYMIFKFMQLGRRSGHPHASDMFMIGCFILAFELQPIPVNFMTLPTALPLGATLWYALRRAGWETGRLNAAARAAAPAIDPAASRFRPRVARPA